MAKSFKDLAAKAEAGWSEDARRVHRAVSAEFKAEVSERAALGAMLAQARKEQALTQPALSEMTGVQQAEISRIERGVGNPTASTLMRLADALGKKLTIAPR